MFELRPYGNKRNNAVFNPFREMDEFERRFFASPSGFFENGSLDEFKTDIKDEGDRYELKADLPGFDKKDIVIDVNGDVLQIKAERHLEQEEKDEKRKYVRCERSYGCYMREFDVSGVNTGEIKAKYENGVLNLTLPKKNREIPPVKHLEIE